MKYRLTARGDRDISQILADTYAMFGERQFNRYVNLIEAGMVRVADDPDWPTSDNRSDLGRGVRSLHLQLLAKRKGAASHVIYYRATFSDRDAKIVVLRVLSDKMDPRRRVKSALHDEERG